MGSSLVATEQLNTASRARHFARRLRSGDAAAHVVLLMFGCSILVLAGLLFVELFSSSSLARGKFGWTFLTGTTWDPVSGDFGALPFIFGTLVTSAVALAVSVPLSIGAATFLSELAPPGISDAIAFLIELLAAVPSVIYGLLGVFVLVPFMRQAGEPFLRSTLGFLPLFQGPALGVGMLTAGLVLALMVVPFIVSVSREALLAVPREQREGALALGATRWECTWHVVLPYGRLAIIGSIFLALARALGETMAVTMVIGNDPAIRASLFAPGYSIAAVIANEFTEATGQLHVSALVELALVLFGVSIVINGLARLMILATTRRQGAHA